MITRSPYRRLFFITAFLWLCTGCDTAVELQFNNPHDPESHSYVPAPPASLNAVVEGDTAVSLTWEDNSTGEDGFAVEQWIGMNGDFQKIGTVGPNTTSYRDLRALEQNIEYHYRVVALRSGRRSEPTNIFSIKFYMNVPQKMGVSFVSSTSCRLSLSFPGYFRYYIIEQSVNGGQFTVADTAGQERTYYQIDGLDTTNVYSFRFKASTGRNESVNSPAVSIEYVFSDAQIVRTFDLGLPVHSVTFSPDGSRLAATGLANALKVWNTTTGTLIHDLSYVGPGIANYSWPYQCVFSSDGSLLAAHCEALSATGIRVWNTSSGTAVKTLGITGRSFAFSSNNADLYVGGLNGTVTIRNISADTTAFEWTAHGFNNDVTLLHTIKNGTQLISGSSGSAEYLRVWSLGTVGILQLYSGYNNEFYNISTDETLVSAGPYVRDMNSGNLVRTFSVAVTGQTCITLNNTHVIEKKYDGKLTVFSIYSGIPVWSKTLTRANVYTYPAIAASPKLNIFVTASSQENKIDLWVMKYAWRVF